MIYILIAVVAGIVIGQLLEGVLKAGVAVVLVAGGIYLAGNWRTVVDEGRSAIGQAFEDNVVQRVPAAKAARDKGWL